jgi:hypothetical protein
MWPLCVDSGHCHQSITQYTASGLTTASHNITSHIIMQQSHNDQNYSNDNRQPPTRFSTWIILLVAPTPACMYHQWHTVAMVKDFVHRQLLSCSFVLDDVGSSLHFLLGCLSTLIDHSHNYLQTFSSELQELNLVQLHPKISSFHTSQI